MNLMFEGSGMTMAAILRRYSEVAAKHNFFTTRTFSQPEEQPASGLFKASTMSCK